MNFDGMQIIDGHREQGAGPAFTSSAPATDAVFWHGHFADPDQAHRAVTAADTAFSDWRRRSVDERMEIIDRYSAIAAERKEDMAALISQETGKALWDARTEAGAIAGKGTVSLKAYHDRTPTRRDGATALTHRPHGVCVVIGPFNFPGHLPNGHIIPALIAGNTIVLKPSEQTPAVAELMLAWWEEAGLPAGVINLVHGGAEIAQALIGHPRTRGIFFTGGVGAGLAIHKSLAGHPEKILALELGGNNPLVAWDVADTESAATVIARSAFITGGQRCTCARRLIVEDGPKGQALIDSVAALIPRLRVDQPDASPEPFIGSLINKQASEAVFTAQDMMLGQGGTAVVEAQRSNAGSAFATPGLIDTTDWTARKDEEVFGPLLQVIRVKTFEDAVETANATRFGLSAGLLSDKAAHWDAFSQDIEAGIVNWNRQTTGAAGTAPFGGPGLSGNHRPAGYYSADYCAWPVASIVADGPLKDEMPTPGLAE
ncbi:MAG: succinylglutamate-semialdehyde dehydrogenase [Parvularcula sp.]